MIQYQPGWTTIHILILHVAIHTLILLVHYKRVKVKVSIFVSGISLLLVPRLCYTNQKVG